jgi:hypothetical protein
MDTAIMTISLMFLFPAVLIAVLAVHIYNTIIANYKEQNKKEIPYILRAFLALLITCLASGAILYFMNSFSHHVGSQ